MNDDPNMTNASRNKAKSSSEVDIQYGEDDGGIAPAEAAKNAATAQTDQNNLMMQMMQTMQQIQTELSELKGVKAKTPRKTKTAV
jgi:hypothetical protein